MWICKGGSSSAFARHHIYFHLPAGCFLLFSSSVTVRWSSHSLAESRHEYIFTAVLCGGVFGLRSPSSYQGRGREQLPHNEPAMHMQPTGWSAASSPALFQKMWLRGLTRCGLSSPKHTSSYSIPSDPSIIDENLKILIPWEQIMDVNTNLW